MRGPWRAALALALHLGFFAVPVCVVVGLAGTSALSYRADATSGLKVALVTAVIAVLLLIGARGVLRIPAQARGTEVSKSAQPKMWKMAESIASATGAPSPRAIRVTAEPRCALRQDTSLLGLRRRGYALEIGLPLLAGLNVSELNALVAREIGHLVGHGRMVAKVYRIAGAVEHTMATMTPGPTKWLFAGYAKTYRRISGRINHTLQLDAVALAVTIAGKKPSLTAMRKEKAIQLGWAEYSEKYLKMATTTELTPDVLLGLRSFLEHPERKPELAERAKEAIAEEPPARNNERPSTRECVEMAKRLSSPEREVDDKPAFTLLRNPRKSVPQLEDKLLVDGLGPRTPWSDLAERAGAAQVAEQAAKLSSAATQSGVGPEPAIGAVLAAIHRGEGHQLVNPVLDPGLDPERVDEAVEDTLTELVAGAVVDALVLAGHAQHELNWAGPLSVRLSNGQQLDPDQLVRPAIRDPRLIPGLHRALVNLGVPLGHFREPAEEPAPKLAGIVGTTEYRKRRFELLVTDRGLLLVPSRRGTLNRLFSGALAKLQRAEQERLAELAERPLDELRDKRGTLWVDSRDIATAQMREQKRSWALRMELYLDSYSLSRLDVSGGEEGTTPVVLRGTRDSEEHGDPYGGLSELMGARMNLDDPALARA